MQILVHNTSLNVHIHSTVQGAEPVLNFAKSSIRIGLISKLRHSIPRHILLYIYQTFIHPHLNFGRAAWDQASKTSLNEILILQKKVLRIMYFTDKRKHNNCRVCNYLTQLFKTTFAECVDKKEDSLIQSDVEELIAKSNQNKFQLNESKCKELRISFAKSTADFAPIVINGKAIEVVSTVKLLGLNISSDLRWNCHVAE